MGGTQSDTYQKSRLRRLSPKISTLIEQPEHFPSTYNALDGLSLPVFFPLAITLL